jgi:glutamyl-tRNA synthetase
MKNAETPLEQFKFSIGKMGKSGALFDLNKLNDISKNELAKLSEEEMYDFLYAWTEEFGTETQKKYFADKEYLLKVLTLCMGVGGKKRRKDFYCAAQATDFISYFFDESFAPVYEYRFENAVVKSILQAFTQSYSYADDMQTWFEKVKAVASAHGFATDMKAYKANPENYPGSVADVAEILRVATTGQANTPDLWTIMQILGEERTLKRLQIAKNSL